MTVLLVCGLLDHCYAIIKIYRALYIPNSALLGGPKFHTELQGIYSALFLFFNGKCYVQLLNRAHAHSHPSFVLRESAPPPERHTAALPPAMTARNSLLLSHLLAPFWKTRSLVSFHKCCLLAFGGGGWG